VDAITLDSVLRSILAKGFGEADVPEMHFKKVTPWVEGPWDGTKTNDYGFSGTIPAQSETLVYGSCGISVTISSTLG